MLFAFDDFVLDCDRRELRRGAALVPVEPKVFDFLTYVVRNRHRVVSKDDLIDAVWMGRIVSDSALATCISSARAALADRGDKPRLIKTLPRIGLRFIGAVQDDERSPASNPARDLPQRPSIAVLPFQNISNDPAQEYLCDGFVEDVISALARIKWLFVAARNSSFVYKGASVDVRRVGRELGVRYLLEGSVRKEGHRVRVSSRLIETESGLHIWAERYDRVWNDIFALQDDLSINIAGAIEPRLRALEIERIRRKRPESLQAYDLVLRALQFSYRHTTTDAEKAIPRQRRNQRADRGSCALGHHGGADQEARGDGHFQSEREPE